MTSASDHQTPDANSNHGALPYPPSFVDHLMAWIESLPGPAWAFYLLFTLAFVVLGHGLRWLDGSLQPGTFDFERLANDSLTVYPLAILHLLNVTARRSLDEFRPALGSLEAEVDELRYKMTTLSPRFVFVTTGIGFLIAFLNIATNPTGWGIDRTASPVTNVFSVLQATLEMVSFIGFFFHAIQQLRLIAYIHRAATNINLYESASHHAFSRLTVRTSLGLVFPIYYFTFIVYLFNLGGISGMSAIDLAMIVIIILVSLLVFILPLNGMHHRLVREKARLIIEADRRFESAVHILHECMDTGKLDDVDVINRTMASLILERDTLKKISTWPWEAETMRGFLSSVGLPILLWLVTTILSRLFE